MSSGQPIQIIAPSNHKFELQIDNLKRILEVDEIKNRNVVIVSVAGAFRKGKSFLLNFFLKYLHAQYKKNDVTDWLDENNSDSGLNGFEFAGGRKPKTTGIWMWSEVFTHDFEDGEKVAIILMDTQGIFDSRTSLRDNTIFAISMMLSSVQCCNVMQNVQEDDFQNLELFSEYGRFALQMSNEKAFQKLLFIVRDWPNSTEFPYGNGQVFINELLAESAEHTEEMKRIRARIKSSFDQIGAYLMPSPGNDVATGRNNHGDLTRIDAEFIDHLKKLVPSILAPQNLVLKKINGRKLPARDLIAYLQTYVNMFNDEATPNPNTVMVGTALAAIVASLTECLDFYIDSMQKSPNDDKPYFDQIELKSLHDDAKAKTMLLFQEKRLLGGDEFIEPFRNKLINDIEAKYRSFSKANEEKEKGFKALARANIQVLYMDCLKSYEDSMQKSLHNVESFLRETDIQRVHESAKRDTLSQFEAHKVQGEKELFGSFRNKLEDEIGKSYTHFEEENRSKRKFIEELKNETEEAKSKAVAEAKAEQMQKSLAEARADAKNLELFNDCLIHYTNAMRSTLNENDSFHSESHLGEIHERTKSNWLLKFKTERDNGGRDTMIEVRLGTAIDMNYISLSYENDSKRRDFKEKEALRNSNRQLQEQLQRAQNKSTSEPDSFFGQFFGVILKAVTSIFSF